MNLSPAPETKRDKSWGSNVNPVWFATIGWNYDQYLLFIPHLFIISTKYYYFIEFIWVLLGLVDYGGQVID